jgi:hypothetical protein
MAGLLLLFVLIAWLLLCIWLTKGIVKNLRSGLIKVLVAFVSLLGLLVAPIVDDILGSLQYSRYCAAADDVKILDTISLTADGGLHSANGDWLLATLEPSQHAERDRLQRLAESLVRWDSGTPKPTASLYPITERTTRIYDVSSQRLLAEFKSYYYRGGFLRSSVFESTSQCFPTLFHSGIYPKIFVFRRS